MNISKMIAEHKAETKEKAKKRRDELRRLERVAAVMGDADPTDIHFHTLYGVVAGVTFGSDYQAYGLEDNRQTMQQVADLLEKYPPVPVWKISDGCTAMRPDWNVSDDEAMKDNAEKIWGVMLRTDYVSGQTQKVSWYTEIDGVRLKITAVLRPDNFPVRIDMNARRDRRTGKVLEIMHCNLEQNPAFHGHFWMDQRIRWASGSREYANPFSLYWLSIDDSQGAGKAWLEQICGLID